VKAKIDPTSAEAEVLLRKTLDLAPDYTEAYWNLADVLRCQQRHQEAIELLQCAAQTNPENNSIERKRG
jgi:tetratricopeptide (TPR) repeat protein